MTNPVHGWRSIGLSIVSAGLYSFGPFRLDPRERQLLRNGRPVPLTPKVFDLLCLLVSKHGRVLSKDEIMETLWHDAVVEEANLVQNISVLRKALGHSAGNEYIETVPRFGYRFVAPVGVGQELPSRTEQRQPHPETRYARSGDLNIAYQVIGEGPIDLVFVMGWVSHLEYFWAEPSFGHFLRKLASFSRLILFDKRGTGLSDRVPLTALPTLEQRMDDVRAVMDATGSRRAAILGISEGGPMSALFAATYPEKTLALIMIGTYARRLRDVDYPWGPTVEERAAYLREIRDGWGGPVGVEERAPSRADDPQFREWWATYLRMGASPGAAIALTQMNADIDVRHVLPLIKVPSLVIHRSGDRCLKVDEGRYVASMISNSRFVELPGEDHLPFVGNQDEIVDSVRSFLAEVQQEHEAERVLATVMFVGLDARPTPDLTASISREIAWFRGQEIREGPAPVAVFDGPARAIRCASSILSLAQRAGSAARAALHTGECDRFGQYGVRGVAVDIAGRILHEAPIGQVVVSSTVRDLVAGSGITFVNVESGVVESPHGEWKLFRVERSN
jgi:DNA-binding winged helix-turn-helix (wHTH) protein